MVWRPTALNHGKHDLLHNEQKGVVIISVMRYYSNRTWCILHGYHEGLVFQEVLIVLDDIWVVEQFQHLTLILSRQAFVS